MLGRQDSSFRYLAAEARRDLPVNHSFKKEFGGRFFGAKSPLLTGVSLLLVRPSPPFIATQLSQCWVVDEGVGLFG